MNINKFISKTTEIFDKIEGIKANPDRDEISSIKDSILVELDECIKIIREAFEKENLEGLKDLEGQVQLLGEKYEASEVSEIFQSVFDEKQQAIDDKIDTIISELAKDIFILENKSAPYLDDYRLLKGAPGDKKIEAVFQQWFISQAVLYENSRELSPATKRQINQMIFQAYRKSAGFSEARSLNVQTSPLYPFQTGYYRHDQFKITQNCYDAYAKDMGVEGCKLYLIDSPLLREVFNREAPHPHLDLDIDSVQKFETLIDHLLNDLKEENHNTGPVLADLSRLFEARNLKPAQAKELMHELEEIVEKKMMKFPFANPIQAQTTKNKLIADLQLMVFLKHHDEDVLLLPALFDRDSNSLVNIDEMIGRSGFRISPAETIEAWLKIASPEDIFRQENIPLASLATKGSSIPTVINTWNDFIQHPLIKKLEDLSTEPNAPQYQKVMTKATVNLLKGLSNCKIEEAYGEKKIDDLLQIAYFRMLNAMGEAIFRKADFIDFYNQIELIHQEIQTILTLAAPYGEEALAESVIHNLTKGNPVLPPGLDRPKVHLKASAMHCMASVIASAEAQKENESLNVVVLKDSYFESSRLLENAPSYHLSVLDGDRFNDGIEKAFLKQPEEPIDLFICEFHHNISLTRQEYHPENITRQIKTMHQKGLLAEKCTVVIDTTINLDQSDEVRKFLADKEIRKMIEEGKLNVVLLHSAQKFDMLGFDNYYGGITTSINAHKSFESFNKRMDHQLDQLKGFNYQGLTHLQKYGGIDNYRKAIMKNTHKLYGMLPKEAIFHEGIKSPMQISKNQDELQVFIDIKFPGFPSTGFKVSRKLREFAKARKLPLTARSSFGFANTNLSTINNDIFRLNPGLDEEKNLAQYAEFFGVIHKALSEKMVSINHLPQEEQDTQLADCIHSLTFPPPPSNQT